jgi:hypothetical protein
VKFARGPPNFVANRTAAEREEKSTHAQLKNECVEKLARSSCFKEGFQQIKKVTAISVYDGMEWDGEG